MDIANDGKASVENHRRGSYDGVSYVGRSRDQLDKCAPSKRANVSNWPREQLHVWNLVRAMLDNMGYTRTK